MRKKLLLFSILFIVIFSGKANTCSTNAGTFSSWAALTWTCSSAPLGGPPGCGDVMNVSAGTTVNVSADVDYSGCASPITLNIYGTMNFNVNGVRFKLPAGSSVYLGAGGSINKTYPGGGSSTLISIGGVNVWTAGDGTVTGPQTLPIELISFTAKPLSTKIILEWSTASEIHNDYFTVEHSTDAFNFEVLGNVDGAGNSTAVLSYSLEDLSPETGVNYYRLKQTDYDNHSTFSEIISSVFVSNSDISFNLYPNPNSGDLANVSIAGLWSQKLQIEVFDILGKQVFQNTFVPRSPGENIFTVDPELPLKPGIYIVTIVDGDDKLSKRWIVN